MYIEENEFAIGKFAKKHVKRLAHTSSLWDVIELMNDFSIRHVPIVEGSKVIGVVNAISLIDALLNYTDPSTFEQPAPNFVNHDFLKVTEEESVLKVIQAIAQKPSQVALIMDGYIFQGIFSDIDILQNDYLWSKLDDSTITMDTKIGTDINEFTCVPADCSIQQALELMIHLSTEFTGIIDSSSKILVGTLSVMDIIHYLMFHYKELGSKLEYMLETPINTIFPKSGLYVREPILFSTLRQEMYDNNAYLSVLLNEIGYPAKLITVYDIIQQYIHTSGFPIGNNK